jgi:hypothetical protein
MGHGVGAIMNKGKKSKPGAKKTSGKKKGSTKKEKEKDTAEVRKDLVKLVKEAAQAMATAVVHEGKKGQVSPVKYLLEMAGIFPVPEAEVNAPDKNEQSLAETLLDRLGIPKYPVAADRYAKEDEEIVLLPAVRVDSEPSVEGKTGVSDGIS